MSLPNPFLTKEEEEEEVYKLYKLFKKWVVDKNLRNEMGELLKT